MAMIEVSEDGVRRAAGGEVFAQAKERADKVSGLRAGGPVISAMVDGVPVSARMLPDGIAGASRCPADGLCAHAAAAVLAWGRPARPRTSRTSPRVAGCRTLRGS